MHFGIAFWLTVVARVAYSKPVTPLILKIDKPVSSPFNPTSSNTPVAVLNVAGIQIYGTNCPPEGCIRLVDKSSYTHTYAQTFYHFGAGSIQCNMSSYMSYQHDVLDRGPQNVARNSSYCIDADDSTYCATDFSGSLLFSTSSVEVIRFVQLNTSHRRTFTIQPSSTFCSQIQIHTSC